MPYRGFKSSTMFWARLLIEQRRLGYNHSLYQCNIARALRHHPIHLLPEGLSVLTETNACLSKPRFEHSWPWNIPLSWRNLHYQDTATVWVCSIRQHGYRETQMLCINLKHFRILPCPCLFWGLVTLTTICLGIVISGLSSLVKTNQISYPNWS